MRSRRLRLAVVAAAAVMAWMAIPAASAQSDEIGVIVGGALGDQDLVGADEDDTPAPVGGLRYAHLFGDGNWSLFTDVTGSFFSGSTALGDPTEYAVRVGPEFISNNEGKWRLFVAPALGWAKFDVDQGESFDRPIGSLGFGQRREFDSGNHFRWEVRGETTFDNGEDLNGAGVSAGQFLLGYNWGFGAEPTDTDGDGVNDRKDKCPDTPSGCTVDEKGCPADSDGDGVCDGLDRCPDTTQGWAVNTDGCPKDTDGDGVSDGADKCPDTPKGCKVDASGCPADADGDGVCDGLDTCASTPKGCKVDAKGCPVDADGDGVCDGIDTCSSTPRGCKVDAKGCPMDTDGDGVCDGVDQCADTIKGAAVDERGCSQVPQLFTDTVKTLALEGVTFANNSDQLVGNSKGVLDRIAEAMKAFPDAIVEVGGHSDSTGADAYNLKLSEKRAKAVRDYLVSKGVDGSRLTSKGYGETKPVADNKTAEGRAKNRRVELKKLN